MLVAGLVTSVVLLFGQLVSFILRKIKERKEADFWYNMTHRRNMKFYA